MRHRDALAIALLAASPCLGCHITVGPSNITVDGVELEARHEEILEVDAWGPQGLRIECAIGDVRVEPTDGPNQIHVVLHETVKGDARATLEDGRLGSATSSGQPSAIGDVVVRTNSPIARLAIETGMGDVDVRGVRVDGSLALETGMGDVSAKGIGRAESLVASTGMGDVEIADASCTRLEASSGMGDVEVTEVEGGDAHCSSGMGDVDVRRSHFDRLDATTGLGDVDCRDTTFAGGGLSSGLGDVRNR